MIAKKTLPDESTLQRFDSFPAAFDYCREADKPMVAIVTGVVYKLFPSGNAVPMGQAAPRRQEASI